MAPPPLLLLTRPADAAARFAAEWRARVGAEAPVLIAPVTEIRALPPERDPGGYRVLIFTSANGVSAAGRPARGQAAWCVGRRTAEAAAAAGFRARAAGGDAEALIAAIRVSGDSGPFLHLRGREARVAVAARLRAAGMKCDEAVVYEQRPLPLSEAALACLAGPAPVLLPLFSANSASRLAAAIGAGGARAPLRLAAISHAAASAWDGPAPARLLVARRPDAPAMLETLQLLAESP